LRPFTAFVVAGITHVKRPKAIALVAPEVMVGVAPIDTSGF
jgi:hypothetical protein